MQRLQEINTPIEAKSFYFREDRDKALKIYKEKNKDCFLIDGPYKEWFEIKESEMLKKLGIPKEKGLHARKIIPQGTVEVFLTSICLSDKEVREIYGLPEKFELTLGNFPFSVDLKGKIGLPSEELYNAACRYEVAPLYFINHAPSIKLLKLHTEHDPADIESFLNIKNPNEKSFKDKYLEECDGYVLYGHTLYFASNEGLKKIKRLTLKELDKLIGLFPEPQLNEEDILYNAKDVSPTDLKVLSEIVEVKYEVIPNAQFVLTEIINEEGEPTSIVLVETTRDILEGEEILIDYGSDYAKFLQEPGSRDVIKFPLIREKTPLFHIKDSHKPDSIFSKEKEALPLPQKTISSKPESFNKALCNNQMNPYKEELYFLLGRLDYLNKFAEDILKNSSQNQEFYQPKVPNESKEGSRATSPETLGKRGFDAFFKESNSTKHKSLEGSLKKLVKNDNFNHKNQSTHQSTQGISNATISKRG